MNKEYLKKVKDYILGEKTGKYYRKYFSGETLEVIKAGDKSK